MKSLFVHSVKLAGALILLSVMCPRSNAQSILGGNPTISITTGLPGSEPSPVTSGNTTIRFKLQNGITKFTVRTTCPGQRFNLSVVVTSIPYGIPAPPVNLLNGMLDTNLVTDIQQNPPNSNLNANIRYTGSATFSQGNSAELGDDVHTVTYTLIEQ